MFERDEVLQDLHNRLVAAGINPLDPKVQAICEVVNAYYAEKTLRSAGEDAGGAEQDPDVGRNLVDQI